MVHKFFMEIRKKGLTIIGDNDILKSASVRSGFFNLK